MWNRSRQVQRCSALVMSGNYWNGRPWDQPGQHWENGPHQCQKDTKDKSLVLCWQHREQIYNAVRLPERRKERS